jgi:hypothetical protein
MAKKWIRGGVPREINLFNIDLDPAEGETITYMLSGRSGAVHIAGNSQLYQESNPHLGGFNQTVNCDDDDFESLKAAQENGERITGYVTHANGVTYSFEGGIANDGPLENDNGNVALECRGKYERQ